MFFADPAAAFANLRRAGTANGRLSFVCWGPLADNPHWHIPLGVVARHLGPPDPPPPGAPGPMSLSDRTHLGNVLTAAGYRNIDIAEAHPMLHTEEPAAEARFMTSMGPASALIRDRGADEATVRAIEAELTAALARFATAEGVAVPALVFVVTARV